jgi:hypothetical protein
LFGVVFLTEIRTIGGRIDRLDGRVRDLEG